MAAEKEQEADPIKCLGWCGLLVVITAITFIVVGCTSNNPVYSVTVTGVAGLDIPTSPTPPSPVFNLTVRIDHSGGRLSYPACIDRLTIVSVSYAGAVLGRGSVPQFCASQGKVRERGTMAWAKDVDPPQFLWDQLAGELAAGVAAVDVKVRTPAKSNADSDTVFLCSQAKIGGGPATCSMGFVAANQGLQATPGSTG